MKEISTVIITNMIPQEVRMTTAAVETGLLATALQTVKVVGIVIGLGLIKTIRRKKDRGKIHTSVEG